MPTRRTVHRCRSCALFAEAIPATAALGLALTASAAWRMSGNVSRRSALSRRATRWINKRSTRPRQNTQEDSNQFGPTTRLGQHSRADKRARRPLLIPTSKVRILHGQHRTKGLLIEHFDTSEASARPREKRRGSTGAVDPRNSPVLAHDQERSRSVPNKRENRRQDGHTTNTQVIDATDAVATRVGEQRGTVGSPAAPRQLPGGRARRALGGGCYDAIRNTSPVPISVLWLET